MVMGSSLVMVDEVILGRAARRRRTLRVIGLSFAAAIFLLDLALSWPILHLRQAAAIRLGDAMEQTILTQRLDLQRSGIVDLGLAVQSRDGTISAVEFLRSRDIDPAVIERVLGEPERRRPPSST
jgi:hypothetical protein